MEGVSSTILEAMACETCVVASDVGGNSEIINNDDTGVLIKPNNRKELSDIILDIMENNEKRSKLAIAGLKVVEKYDWKRIGQLYLDVYEGFS
jgi:glycosyltransferase involved in cell wall biosynthesis